MSLRPAWASYLVRHCLLEDSEFNWRCSSVVIEPPASCALDLLNPSLKRGGVSDVSNRFQLLVVLFLPRQAFSV